MHDRVADLAQEISARHLGDPRAKVGVDALGLHDGVVVGLELLVAADELDVEHIQVAAPGLAAERADQPAHVHARLVRALPGERVEPLLAGLEHQEQDRLLRPRDELAQRFHVALVGRACEPHGGLERAHSHVVRHIVGRDQRGRKAGRHERRRRGAREPIPLGAVERGHRLVVDQQRVVDLRAQPGRCPVRAPCPHRGRHAGLRDGDELVVAQALRLEQPVDRDDTCRVQPCTRGCVAVAGFVRAVREHETDTRLERDQRVFEWRVVELVQRRVQRRVLRSEQLAQPRAEVAFEEGAKGRIDAVLELRLERRRRELMRQQVPRHELREHDAAVEVAREAAASRRREPGPARPAAHRAVLVRAAGAAVDHRGDAVAHLVAGIDGMVAPVEALERPLA